MAPLPIISDVFRCALNWTNTSNGMTATNVIHLKNGSANAAAVATALDTNATAAMWGTTPTNCSVNEVIITPLDGSSISFPFLTGKPAKWSGSVSSSDFLPQVASIVKLLTAKRGRSYRGRIYLPWMGESVTTDGVITGSVVTAMTTAWIAWNTAMTSAGFVPQVASYKLATSEAVIAVQCEPTTATQRRRNQR